MAQLQRVAVLRRLVEDVSFASDVGVERHHQAFANRIDRGIGDLREGLLEIIEQQLRLVGQASQRRVDAHRADRLFARKRGRRENRLQVFVGIAEGALAHQDRFVVGGLNVRRARQMIERNLVVLQPLRVGLPRRQLLLDLFIRNQPLLFGIHQEDAAGRQPALHAAHLRA